MNVVANLETVSRRSTRRANSSPMRPSVRTSEAGARPHDRHAVKAGGRRRTIASALMFLAAQHVSASPSYRALKIFAPATRERPTGAVFGPRAKEVAMLAQPFEKPVHVWVGLGFPRQLNTVVDAYQFASEWGGKSPEQRAATRACKAALAGEVDPETARGVFVAFARKQGHLGRRCEYPHSKKRAA